MANYEGKFGTTDNEKTNQDDVFNSLFVNSDNNITDDEDDSIKMPSLIIDINELDERTRNRATTIAEKLSAYYFDQKYIDEHPYISDKIEQEIDNIRRLLKMLAVNEKAQDTLILSITLNCSKGTLYGSLTSLQNSMLQMQSQLNQLTSNLEDIFKEMQDNCEKTFADKEKEESPDGTVIVRGSRDFIREMTERINAKKREELNTNAAD